MPRLNDFLFNVDLTEVVRYIETHGSSRLYHKDEILCEQGKVCRRIAIVRKGYFRYFVINSTGERCITGFSFHGEVVTDFVCSFVSGNPSFASVAAGCDAEVVEIDLNIVRQFMAETHPDFVGQTSAHLLVEAYRRYIDLHTKSPKERYIELICRCHEDISLIPLQEIASYLSISRRQLQRIRETII